MGYVLCLIVGIALGYVGNPLISKLLKRGEDKL